MKIWPEFKISKVSGPWWKFKDQPEDWLVAGLSGSFVFFLLSFSGIFDDLVAKTGTSIWVIGSWILGMAAYPIIRRIQRKVISKDNKKLES